jgi:hypothetical protein
MPKAPFPISPVYTGIAIAYRNARMIADEVMPRVTVGKAEFKYIKYALVDGFTVPDTKVGRKSRPNQVEFGGTEATGSTDDFGLDDPIPQSDIDNAPEQHDPRARSVEQITNIIELDREIRVAGMVFNAANYAAANQQTLSGASQFSDFVNSDPIGVIMDALDSMVMRANIMAIGRSVFSKLSRHPDIVKSMHGNSGDKGVATRRAIAELFELEDIHVGEAWVNNARKGQPASILRTWGKHLSLIHRDKQADNRNGTTFGFTAQHGTRIAGSWEDKNIGLRGGEMVRAGESVKEVITANDLGYFIEDAVA